MPNFNKNTFKPSWLPERQNTRSTGDQDFLNTSAWRRVAAMHKIEFPLCENCKNKGRISEVRETDHIIPRPIGELLDYRNLMSLCKSCHGQKSSLEGKKGGPLIDYAYGLPVRRDDIFLLLR